MKIYHIPDSVLGDFFYNPLTHEGVGITDLGALIVGMDQSYDPLSYPGCVECEVGEEVFPELLDAAHRYNTAHADLAKALDKFPRKISP